MITLIAAAGENNELGKNNDLPWHLPDDFKRFKALTSHHYIIMGRKTFESFEKPLPHRIHVVITRKQDYEKDGALVVHSISEALEKTKSEKDVFIIGGGEIFELGLPLADKIELTRIHATFKDADAFFPEFSKEEWQLDTAVKHDKDEKHKYAFTFETWTRK